MPELDTVVLRDPESAMTATFALAGNPSSVHRAGRTARAVIEDFLEGVTPTPAGSRDDVVELVTRRGAAIIDAAGWENIDTAERSAGKEAGRRRVKFVSISAMQAAARGPVVAR